MEEQRARGAARPPKHANNDLARVQSGRFPTGCELAIQCVTNVLRCKPIKAFVVETEVLGPRDGGGLNLLGVLSRRLESEGLDDRNIVIKICRCLKTLLWADGSHA